MTIHDERVSLRGVTYFPPEPPPPPQRPAPPAYPGPFAAQAAASGQRRKGRWEGTSKERLPVILAVVGIAALLVVGAIVVGLTTPPLRRAGNDLKAAGCPVFTVERDRLSYAIDWDNIECLIANWPALERLGFDRDDIERSMEADSFIRHGDYQLRAVDSGDDIAVTIVHD